jgi:hypothetical protein
MIWAALVYCRVIRYKCIFIDWTSRELALEEDVVLGRLLSVLKLNWYRKAYDNE